MENNSEKEGITISLSGVVVGKSVMTYESRLVRSSFISPCAHGKWICYVLIKPNPNIFLLYVVYSLSIT